MEKINFQKLAEIFGFRVNEDAIETLATNEGMMDKPDNWDELTDEEKAAWEAEHKPKANAAKVQPEPKKPAPRAAKQDEPDYSNLVKLNALIDDLGGFDAYKALLVSAVDAVEGMQAGEKAERATLTETITTNSAFEEGDLKDMTLPVLRKMAQGLAVDNSLANSRIDYRALGAGSVKANKDDIAVMPDLFALAANTKKED